MEQIKIEKEKDEIIFQKINRKLVLNVNDKKIRIYVYSSQDSGNPENDDFDYEVDANDSSLLTDDEYDVLMDNLSDYL